MQLRSNVALNVRGTEDGFNTYLESYSILCSFGCELHKPLHVQVETLTDGGGLGTNEQGSG